MGLIASTPQPPPETSSVDDLSDEELYALIDKVSHATALGPDNSWCPLIADSVWRLTPDAAVKATYSRTEAFMMSYVSSHTSIPIPKVRRVLPDRDGDPDDLDDTWFKAWIVMDYIEGEALETAWPKMSWWARLRFLWTSRRYIRELHKTPLLTHDVPGPFDANGRPYICRGFYFREDGAGPFQTYADMAAWFDRRRFDSLAAAHSVCGHIMQCSKFDASHPLVLCHMDLHIRNFVVGTDGRIWLIDWANAGAFPAWLEYAQLVLWAEAARHESRPPKIWTWFAPLMIGKYHRYKSMYLDRLNWAWHQPCYDFYDLDYFEKFGLNID